jgi:hypothetical protein
MQSFHRTGPGSILDDFMGDSWWTKLYLNSVLFDFFCGGFESLVLHGSCISDPAFTYK